MGNSMPMKNISGVQATTKLRSGLPITEDNRNENDGRCNILGGSTSRLCIMNG
jgi:hypothetical protein